MTLTASNLTFAPIVHAGARLAANMIWVVTWLVFTVTRLSLLWLPRPSALTMVQEAGVITVAKVGLVQPLNAIAPMSSKTLPTNLTIICVSVIHI